MEEIIKKRIEKRNKIINEAKKFVFSLKGKYTAFLIGSYARGDFNTGSDVDILLIGDFMDENPLKRLLNLDFPAGYEVIALTEQEFWIALENNDPIIWDVLAKCIVLRDDYGLTKKINIKNKRDLK
ncbi:MAG: nucleotidyltransferase domain-containing protein [Thermoproteota archaeon]|jgi:predicted nucleotidyltransferase|nr:nucleotidyltransferase domain-containing protein [Thermoproteota archaeon]